MTDTSDVHDQGTEQRAFLGEDLSAPLDTVCLRSLSLLLGPAGDCGRGWGDGSTSPHSLSLILKVLCLVQTRSHLQPLSLGSSQISLHPPSCCPVLVPGIKTGLTK